MFRSIPLAIPILVGVIVGPAAGQPAAPRSMPIGGSASQPIGHFDFCQVYQSECRRTGNAAPLPLTTALLERLEFVNRHVNTAITSITDAALYNRADLWEYPSTAGDCEDFVLLKRRILADAGWPLSTLLITMVLQPNGEAHAVLTVRTDRGDYVLDNLSAEVRLWTDTPYTYVKRQSHRDAGAWVTVSDEPTFHRLPAANPDNVLGPLGVIGVIETLGNIARP